MIKTLHEIVAADIKSKPHKRRVRKRNRLDACTFEKELHKTEDKTMNNLKKLALAICLVLALSGAALAGEVNAPPCTNDPGEVNAPPCPPSQLLIDDSVAQTSASLSIVETLTIVTAISAIENLLTIY